MHAQNAAPERCLAADSRDGELNGNRKSIPADRIPARVIERLALEGVHDLADWRALGQKRHLIFGITPSVTKQLDHLERESRL